MNRAFADLRAPVFVLCLLATGAACSVETMKAWARDGEEHATSAAIISFGHAAPVLNRVLLVRGQEGVCALRFLKYERGHDAKPGTVFNTGDETLSAEYEWAFYSKGRPTQSGHRKVSRGPIVGIGRLIIPSTRARIECGPIKGLAWSYPLYVSMYINNKRDPGGLQFAPTSCANLSAAQAGIAIYGWYSYQENRATLYIPQSQLRCSD
jgi:hypothetical protein